MIKVNVSMEIEVANSVDALGVASSMTGLLNSFAGRGIVVNTVVVELEEPNV